MEESSVSNTNSLRDAQGRVKLLTSVGKGTRAVIFFLFIWRDVYLYELASNAASSFTRLCCTLPVATLLLLNVAGFVASFGSSGKKRLKAILNLDKLMEILLMIYAFARLTLFPAKGALREVYVGNLIHSIAFLVQAQACTRFSWDEKSAVPLASYHDAHRRSDELRWQQQQQMHTNMPYQRRQPQQFYPTPELSTRGDDDEYY